MEIFEPQKFFQMAELLANVLTGAVAIVGLLIALLTYKVAERALLEWKNQKNLEYLERFLKVFYKSKNFINHLRHPISMDSEILERHKKSFYKDEILDKNLFSIYYEELLIISRRETYIPMLEELYELKSLAKVYVKNDSLITEYINYIIKTDKEIIKAAQTLSFYKKLIREEYSDRQGEDYKEARKITSENRKVVYGMSNDEINKKLEDTFVKCEEYLTKMLNKYHKI